MAVRYDEGRRRWTVEFEQAGIRVFQRLPKGCSRAQGEAREAQLRREIYDRETLLKVPTLTIESAINQWLTEDHRRKNKKKAQSEAKQWEPHIKSKLLREVPEVAQTAIKTWSDARISTPAGTDASKRGGTSPVQRSRGAPTPATINRRLAMLKAVCRHAYKQGRIGDNLSGRITMLREDNKRERYLTRGEVTRLVACASDRPTASAITIAVYTGLRASELLALTPDDLHKGTLTVRTSKNHKPRIVPVPSPALPLLQELPLQVSYWQLRKDFLAACRKAKLKNVRFHDLRHTCASWLINAGVDLYSVGRILGHSSQQTTARYAHLSHQSLKKAMDRLK